MSAECPLIYISASAKSMPIPGTKVPLINSRKKWYFDSTSISSNISWWLSEGCQIVFEWQWGASDKKNIDSLWLKKAPYLEVQKKEWFFFPGKRSLYVIQIIPLKKITLLLSAEFAFSIFKGEMSDILLLGGKFMWNTLDQNMMHVDRFFLLAFMRVCVCVSVIFQYHILCDESCLLKHFDHALMASWDHENKSYAICKQKNTYALVLILMFVYCLRNEGCFFNIHWSRKNIGSGAV